VLLRAILGFVAEQTLSSMGIVLFLVREVVEETDVCDLRLESVDGASLPCRESVDLRESLLESEFPEPIDGDLVTGACSAESSSSFKDSVDFLGIEATEPRDCAFESGLTVDPDLDDLTTDACFAESSLSPSSSSSSSSFKDRVDLLDSETTEPRDCVFESGVALDEDLDGLNTDA
jgi:hypothetical protein